jgi:hypothetical protein
VTDDVSATYYLGGFARAAQRVAVQAHCSFDEATDLMVDRADVEQCSLGDLAIAVVEGRIRFTD